VNNSSDYLSPYKELGLNAHAKVRPVKKKRAFLYVGKPAIKKQRTMHRFELAFGDKKKVTDRLTSCRYCHQPKFAVEGLKCLGR